MSESNTLDRTNLRILSILQREARVSNQQLADQIHLSPSACLERVKKLEKGGYVRAYLGLVELEKVCRSVTVITTVTVHDHRKKNFDRFEEAARSIPEVVECVMVSGGFDFVLRVVCSDMNRYRELCDELLEAGPGNLELSSHVVLATPKPFSGVPLERLVPG